MLIGMGWMTLFRGSEDVWSWTRQSLTDRGEGGTGVSDVKVGVASSLRGGASEEGVVVGGSTFFLPSQPPRRLPKRVRNISLTCLRFVVTLNQEKLFAFKPHLDSLSLRMFSFTCLSK